MVVNKMQKDSFSKHGHKGKKGQHRKTSKQQTLYTKSFFFPHPWLMKNKVSQIMGATKFQKVSHLLNSASSQSYGTLQKEKRSFPARASIRASWNLVF